MEMKACLLAAALAAMLSGCGGDAKPPAAAVKAEAPKPADESRHLPKTGMEESHVVDRELLGKSFMPGGTIGHYKSGKKEFEMFVAKLPGATDAALLLLDWKKELKDSTFVASFGGYFGDDGGKPVFVFPKGQWIAGVVGLPQKEADLQARALAGLLN
jgi:hypothetical protein